MEPAHYLTSSYYEHWLTAAATLAVEGGLVTRRELEERAGGPFPLARRSIDVVPKAGDPPARFDVGDAVRVRGFHPPGHTRCPRYVRGHVGVVLSRDGSFPLPDVEAHCDLRPLEQTYTVRFEAEELWGDRQPGVRVCVGLWDSYLEEVA
jgi:nitrile hydratase